MSMMDRKIVFFLMTYISVADIVFAAELCGAFGFMCSSLNAYCPKDSLSICLCRQGYTGDGETCTDRNECITGRHSCDTYGICSNTQGSYTCSCRSGFTGNGWTCYDINECTPGRHQCDRTGGICTNTKGSYRCSCKTGYTGNGVTCTDINECSTGRHNCDRTNGICTNTQGSFRCSCKSGYIGNGVTCTDANECSTGSNNCDRTGGICTNIVGSFTCSCKTGFTGNGVTCTDIDECTSTVLKHDCDVNAKCTNTVGSYDCKCNRFYFGDGKTCTRGTLNTKITIAFKADFLVAYKNTTSAVYTDFQSKIEIQLTDRCNKGFGDNKCRVDLLSLKPGSTVADVLVSFNLLPPSDLTAFLEQVDDWVKSLPEGTNCTIKGIGDTVCTVKPSASDFDECEEPSICTKPETVCNNTVGRYSCTCKEGFVGDDPEDKGCTDLDECEEPSICNEQGTVCNNTVGGYSCTCREGFVGDDPEDKGCTEPDSRIPIIIGVTVPVIIVIVIVVVVVIFLHRRKQACFAAKQQQEHDGNDLSAVKTDVKNGEDNSAYEAPMSLIASTSSESYEHLEAKTGVRNSNVYETYEEFRSDSNDRAGGEVLTTPCPSAKQQKEHGGYDLGTAKTNVKSGEDNACYEAPLTVIASPSNESYEYLETKTGVRNSNVYETYEEFTGNSNDCAGGEVPMTQCPSESNYENVSYKMGESPDTCLYANVQALST